MSMPAALERRRNYNGPVVFSYGFRPFFLAAGIWAAFGILLWLPQYLGYLTLPTHFTALDWHIHEMIFGYVAATIGGFLLTAIPNWTGRLPVNGWPLAGLALLWLAGRVAILLSAWTGGILAAVIDVSFLVTLAAVAAREIVSGKNWRNLRVLLIVGMLIAGNVEFHVEILTKGYADYGIRIAIAAIIMLISLVGGRIVPSFTNNRLTRNNAGRRPLTFARFDMAVLVTSAIALLAWIAVPAQPISGALLMAAGSLQIARLARWAGDRTIADRLVLVLHVGYLFVPIGFLLIGASVFTPIMPASAGIHAWTTGAIGLMTLAVMTRATLGHTARPLIAGTATQVIYGLALLAALLRIAAALVGSMALVECSGVAWIAAFAFYVCIYGPLLTAQKPAWTG